MDTSDPQSDSGQDPSQDPRRNLFWLFVSFMGISIPRRGQERRALVLLVVCVALVLAFVAAGMFALFHFW